MREEVTRLGARELSTPEEVDSALQEDGTTLVFVNSVCGCAAAGARPGLALSLMQGKKPAQNFALLDLETMERRVLTEFESSSPTRAFDVTPDGTRIVFDRLEEASDIVLIELDGGP